MAATAGRGRRRRSTAAAAAIDAIHHGQRERAPAGRLISEWRVMRSAARGDHAGMTFVPRRHRCADGGRHRSPAGRGACARREWRADASRNACSKMRSGTPGRRHSGDAQPARHLPRPARGLTQASPVAGFAGLGLVDWGNGPPAALRRRRAADSAAAVIADRRRLDARASPNTAATTSDPRRAGEATRRRTRGRPSAARSRWTISPRHRQRSAWTRSRSPSRRDARQHDAALAGRGVADDPRHAQAAPAGLGSLPIRWARPSCMRRSRPPSRPSSCATSMSPTRPSCASRRPSCCAPKCSTNWPRRSTLDARCALGKRRTLGQTRAIFGLDGRDRRRRPRGVLHPEHLSRVRCRRGAGRLGHQLAAEPGCSFSLDAAHINRAGAAQAAFHTLNPALARPPMAA